MIALRFGGGPAFDVIKGDQKILGRLVFDPGITRLVDFRPPFPRGKVGAHAVAQGGPGGKGHGSSDVSRNRNPGFPLLSVDFGGFA